MKKSSSALFAALLISGCSSAPLFETKDVGGTSLIATSAGAGVSTLRQVNGQETTCIRLGPDATDDNSVDFNVLASGTGGGEGSNSDQVEMLGRSTASAYVRDTLFHLCTLRQSQLISDVQYTTLVTQVINGGFDLIEKEVAATTITVSATSAGMTGVQDAPVVSEGAAAGTAPAGAALPAALQTVPAGSHIPAAPEGSHIPAFPPVTPTH